LRRWPLYTAAVAVAFGAQALIATLWRSPAAIEVSNDVALPLLTALVYARVWGDSNENIESSAVWERFLERAWAVIVIDFVASWLLTRAFLASPSPTALEEITGVIAFTLVLFTLFADASATIDDDVTVWNVIPRAFLRSIIITLNLTTFTRALAIFALLLVVFFGQFVLYFALVQYHVAQPQFWSSIPLLTISQPPLAALTVLVYQDAKPEA
jgi:hypothetical protein